MAFTRWLGAAAAATFVTVVVWAVVLAARPGVSRTPRPAAQASRPFEHIPSLTQAQWLNGQSDEWRIAFLRENPAILVVEFPNSRDQGGALNRVAALIEKSGAPRDRVLNDAELLSLILQSGSTPATYLQGHDYSAQELLRFYHLADTQGVTLTTSERRLKAELIRTGIISQQGSEIAAEATERAIITFTAVHSGDPASKVDEGVDPLRRSAVFQHELAHGRYHTRPRYREHARHFWNDLLGEPQRSALTRLLAAEGYDVSQPSLLINEAQAFVFNTPDLRAFRPEDAGLDEKAWNSLRQTFWRTLPSSERLPGDP